MQNQILKKWIAISVICLLANPIFAETASSYTEDKPAIVVSSTQPVFSIRLKSNATTGYAWYLQTYDPNLLQPIKQAYEPPANKKMIGAPGYEVWTFRVKPAGFVVPMQTILKLVYARSWELNRDATGAVFQVTTQHVTEK